MELFCCGDLGVVLPESQVANCALEGGFNGPLEVLQSQLETHAHGHWEGVNGLVDAGCICGTEIPFFKLGHGWGDFSLNGVCLCVYSLRFGLKIVSHK